MADEEVQLHGEEQPHRAGRAVAKEGRVRGGRRSGQRRGRVPQHGADQHASNSSEAEGVVRHARGIRRRRGREGWLEEAGKIILSHFIHGNDQVRM